jgi:hypothetical protein
VRAPVKISPSMPVGFSLCESEENPGFFCF